MLKTLASKRRSTVTKIAAKHLGKLRRLTRGDRHDAGEAFGHGGFDGAGVVA